MFSYEFLPRVSIAALCRAQ